MCGQYRRDMAARDDVQRVASTLTRPREGYVKRVQAARVGMTSRSGEAARQMGVFIDRISELRTDELCELYDETFGQSVLEKAQALIARLVQRHTGGSEARVALEALTPILDRLEADRNPYVYLVRALCFVLLGCVNDSRMEQSSA